MKQIEHVWFDLVGTLTVHTPEFHEAHDKLLNETYAEATGRTVSPELVSEYQELYKKSGTHSAAFRSLGLPSDYWMRRYNAMDQDKFSSPIPEVFETLDKLRTLVPISLFSNDKPENVSRTLRVISVDEGWFTHIITGDDVKERKPALEGFQQAVKKSEISPDVLLYVGDRVSADVRPAKAVGMQTCLVWSESPEADYSFRHFEDLLTLF